MELTALQHSPFLQSLGWAIANSFWQCGLLWAIFLIVNTSYKTASAKFKNTLSTVLMFLAFGWFCGTLFSKYFSPGDAQPETLLLLPSADGISAVWSFRFHLFIEQVASGLSFLSVAYLLLLLFFGVRLFSSYRHTDYIRKNGLHKPKAEWRVFTDKVSRQMGIIKKIRLWISEHVDVPATIGSLKPVILIPLASINQLSAEQMEAIILHELCHIKRNDYLLNLFVSLIETIMFFNPFVILLARIIKRERENCCDDLVIEYQYDRHSYASALLFLEKFRMMNMSFAVTATAGKKQLLDRVKRIIEAKNSSNFNYGQRLISLMLVTGTLWFFAWLASPKAKHPLNNGRVLVLNQKTNADITEKYITKKVTSKKRAPVFAVNNLTALLSPRLVHKKEKVLLTLTPPVTALAREPQVNDLVVADNPRINKIIQPLVWSGRANEGRMFTPRTPFKMQFQYAPGEWKLNQIHQTIIDVQKIQKEVERYMEKTDLYHAPDGFFEKQVHERIKNLKNEVKALEEISAKKNEMNLPHTKALLMTKMDSLFERQILVIDGKQLELTAEEINSAKENRAAKKGSFSFQFRTEGNGDKPVKSSAPRQRPSQPKDVKIYYRNGVIVLYGKNVTINNPSKMIAQSKPEKLRFSSYGKMNDISFD